MRKLLASSWSCILPMEEWGCRSTLNSFCLVIVQWVPGDEAVGDLPLTKIPLFAAKDNISNSISCELNSLVIFFCYLCQTWSCMEIILSYRKSSKKLLAELSLCLPPHCHIFSDIITGYFFRIKLIILMEYLLKIKGHSILIFILLNGLIGKNTLFCIVI